MSPRTKDRGLSRLLSCVYGARFTWRVGTLQYRRGIWAEVGSLCCFSSTRLVLFIGKVVRNIKASPEGVHSRPTPPRRPG